MSNSVFISTVSAKQMAREAEISAGIIRELRELLEAEREQNAALKEKLASAKAGAKTRQRRDRRRVARLSAQLQQENKDYDTLVVSYDRIWMENKGLKSGLEEEKAEHDHTIQLLKQEKAETQRIWDHYNSTYDAWRAMRDECDTLLARCEEREAEVKELRERNADLSEKVAVEQEQVAFLQKMATERPAATACGTTPFLPHEEVAKHLRALGYEESYLSCGPLDFEWKTLLAQKLNFHVRLLRGFPEADEASQEVRFLQHASHAHLRQLMQGLVAGEMLPVECNLGDDTGPEVARDRELNAIREQTPFVMICNPELQREFLLRWRHHHKRLPGGYRVSDLD